MARMPGARWRPLSRNYTRRVTTKDCIILHSTGTNAATSQYGWFNTPGAGASSHFHVDDNGVIEQYVDTAHMSWANASANPRSVTIETQGNGYGPWTAAQVRSIVRVIQWVRSVHKGIPLRQMTSSAASQKGIGWHRLGVNGNFPRTGILRGRSQRGGGKSWSKAFGKICPGDDRIKQIPAIIRQANGHTTAATSTPIPKKDWFSMASLNDLKKAIRDELGPTGWNYKGSGENRDTYSYLRGATNAAENLEKAVADIPKEVWKYKATGEPSDAYAFLRATRREVAALQGENEGLLKALEQVGNVNLDEVRAAAKEGVSKALKNLEADVTLNIDTTEGE